MDIELNLTETRVLGCLMEKEMTTPDYYPLTLRSLTTACNQKTNRDPVVDFDEKTVALAIEELRIKGLAMRVDSAGARVPKYKHNVGARFEMDLPERAILTIFMLRGSQTLGELRVRTERMYTFSDLEEVSDVIKGLEELGDPLVLMLPPRPGQKERRYAHLLSGKPEISEEGATHPALESATLEAMDALQNREKLTSEINELKEEMGALKSSLAKLEHEFQAFKAEFD